MNIALLLLFGLAGYLIGSISFARMVAYWAAPGEDISKTVINIAGTDEAFETTTVSATTLSARKGPPVGMIVAVLDMLKAGVPVWLIQQSYPETPAYFLLFALMALVGHNYPIYYRFVGGRGLSPIMGAYFVIDWVSLLVTMLISSIIGFGVTKKYFLGYGGWLFLMIIAMIWRFSSPLYALYAAAVAALFTFSSIPEFLNQMYKRQSPGHQLKVRAQ